MKKIFTVLGIVAVAAFANAQTVITKWDFDASSLTATTGTGTVTLIGGVEENTQTGTSACNCAFVSGNGTGSKAYTTKTYPLQGEASGTAGLKASVSTAGYTNITASVDVFGSNTASKYVQLQYTTNGTTWVDLGAPVGIVASTWSTLTSGNLPAAADNNANFAVRVVAVFAPATSSYSAIGASSSYAVGGALRYDNIIVNGTSGSLAVADFNKSKSNFVRNTFVKNNEITFGADAKDVKVYTLTGQLVKTASVKANGTLNVADLAEGNYIVTGTVNNQAVSQKILKD